MDATIDGGVPPRGRVRVSGAKNSATRLLAAALLTDQICELGNFPTRLVDVGHKARFIQAIGGDVKLDHEHSTATIDPHGIQSRLLTDFDYPIRTTYLLTAGQILRSGIARIPYPGGCKIGSRGYDLHMMVWKQLGCEVRELETHIEVRGKRFKGGEIRFPISTVGGTENALMCAAIADGATDIFNAYITPEIHDLIDLLHRMGASIELVGNSRVRVEGKPQLNGARMDVIPDRIEALTWIVYAILSRGEVLIESVPFESMQIPLLYIANAGIELLHNDRSVYVHPGCMQADHPQPFEVPCGTHPGVISDMQPFFVLLGMAAAGISRIYDYRYPERIAYIDELKKFSSGALIAEAGKVTVQGPAVFSPADANSTDLRGSMAVIIAALCAQGTSTIRDAHMALRGYNNLPEKLANLGITMKLSETGNA